MGDTINNFEQELKPFRRLGDIIIKIKISKNKKWETEENPDIVLKVREAQIQHLYGQTWSGLTGIMIIMFAVCVALWQVIPHWKLSLWAGTLVLLSIARGFHTVAF